jgi:hypothetical protein
VNAGEREIVCKKEREKKGSARGSVHGRVDRLQDPTTESARNEKNAENLTRSTYYKSVRIYGGDSHPDVAVMYQNVDYVHHSQGN